MSIKEYVDDYLKDFDLIQKDYMKNIFFLGIVYSRQTNIDECKIYLKSHEQIYGINVHVDKVDLIYDECVTGINMNIEQFTNPNQINFPDKQLLDVNSYLLPVGDNKIYLNKNYNNGRPRYGYWE